MTDHILSTPGQATVTCAQLPGQEIALARREMRNTSGGFFPVGRSPMIWFIAERIAEAIVDYFED